MLRFLLVCSLALPLAAAVELPRERETWVRIDAGDLTIFSNASERDTSEIATDLLRMRDAIGRLTQLKVRSAVPTNVYVFRNESSFAPYRTTVFGRNANVTGVFLGSDDANFILLQGDAPSGVDRVVYHELTHYFVKNTLAGLPLWFQEGIAEYYSTFDARGDTVNLGKPVSDHVMWLRESSLIPLAQLFAMNAESKEYNEGTRQGVFYAESWALVHYLFVGSPERHEQLPKFLELLGQKRPIDEAFRAAFHTTYEDMERELKSYVRRMTFSYRRYSSADLALTSVAGEPKPMPRDEVLYRLGDLLARGTAGRAGADAERFLYAAIELNPDQAEAYADLALIHDVAGRAAEAAVEYDRAVRLGAHDPNVYLIYGASILRNAVAAYDRNRKPSASEVARARGLFQKATALAPSSARAYAGVGATYLLTDEDPAPGILALEKSLSLAPGQDDVAMQLVSLYARVGRRDDALRLVDDVIARGGNAEMLRQARESILLADVRRAESLLRDGKTAEAAPILQSVRASTTNEELKTHITQVLGAIDQQNAAEKQAESINQAIDLANKGKVAEALAVIDAMIPQITDPDLLERTKSLREEMAKAAKPRRP